MAAKLRLSPLGIAVWGGVGYLLGGTTGAIVGAGLNFVAQEVVDNVINNIPPYVPPATFSNSPITSRSYTQPGGLGY